MKSIRLKVSALIISSLCIVFNSCTHKSKENIVKEEPGDYVENLWAKMESEIDKQNFKDKIYLGFYFDMDSSMIIKHCDSLINNKVIKRFDQTEEGKVRYYMTTRDSYIKEQLKPFYGFHDGITSSFSMMDSFSDDLAFQGNILLKKGEKYWNPVIAFGISIYKNKLKKLIICYDGKSALNRYEVEWIDEYNVLKEKIENSYGKAKIDESKRAIWVDGIINIQLQYCGIQQRAYKNTWSELYGKEGEISTLYYPYFIIVYSNILIEKEERLKLKAESREREQQEQKEQEDMKKKYNNKIL